MEGLEIRLAGRSHPLEVDARSQLEALLGQWDLRPWFFTREVVIEADCIPHSHPVLTWTSRYLGDDMAALGGFLHEQIHWGIQRESVWPAWDKVGDALLAHFPDLPLDPPAGCGSIFSNITHIMVNHLELEALTSLVGEPLARATLAGRPYYRRIYDIVLNDGAVVQDAVARAGATFPLLA